MTASIVGWAHTPFGKFDTETVESLVVRVATDGWPMPVFPLPMSMKSVLGHFNGGFSAQDLLLRWYCRPIRNLRFKPATRVENACATGSAAVIRASGRLRRGLRKSCWVVGVEQRWTRDAGPGDRPQPAPRILSA